MGKSIAEEHGQAEENKKTCSDITLLKLWEKLASCKEQKRYEEDGCSDCASIFFSFFFFFLFDSGLVLDESLQTLQRSQGLLELGLDLVVINGEVLELGLDGLVLLGQLDDLTLKFLNLQVELTDPNRCWEDNNVVVSN